MKRLFFSLISLFLLVPHMAQAQILPSPGNFVGVAGNQKVYLHWDHPSNRDDVLGYIIFTSGDDGVTFDEGTSVVAPEGGELNNFLTVDNLINGTSYLFKLQSYNERLDRSPEIISDTIIPADKTQTDNFPPEDIRNIETTSFDREVLLTWRDSPNISGDLIGYNIAISDDGGVSFGDPIFVSLNTSYRFEDLANDLIYNFRITSLDTSGNESQGITIQGTSTDQDSDDPTIQLGNEVVSTPTFPDVVDGVFREYIEFLAARDIISGYSDNTFRPDRTLNRAEGITLLLKASDLELDDSIFVQSFEDIDEDFGLAVYIENAYSYSIIDGFSDGTFRPEDPLTRAEFIKIFIEIFSKKLRRVPEAFVSFSDVPTDNIFAPWIYAAYKNGITTGYEDGTFRPDNTISRKEAAAILARFFQQEEDDVISSSIEELQVLSLINNSRNEFDLPLYKINSDISIVARNHAIDIARNLQELTSVGSDGKTPAERLDEAGILYLSVSENVAAASFANRSITETLNRIHEAIMDQPNNRENQKANILSTFKNFTDIGTGVYIDELKQMVYIVVDFVEIEK